MIGTILVLFLLVFLLGVFASHRPQSHTPSAKSHTPYATSHEMTTETHTVDTVYADDSFITVDNLGKGPQYNLTYGELTEPGMREFVRYLERRTLPRSTFIDLGSGNGRSLALAIKHGFRHAKGVEIVDARHAFAVRAIERLPQYSASIELVCGDLFDLQSAFFPRNSTIFVSNLLFPPETNQRLLRFLSARTPDDAVLIVSKLPLELYLFRIEHTLHVPMSWAGDSLCFVLRKSHSPAP